MNAISAILTFLFIGLISLDSKGQPSYSVQFYFKLYDTDGNIVDYEGFCKNFRLLGELDRDDQTPCTNENISKGWFYNDSTKYFNGHGYIVYNDLDRKFVYKDKEMLLILASAPGGDQQFQIDSLVFKPGKYYIKNYHLKFLDYKQASVDYYNKILERAKRIMEYDNTYQKHPAHIELEALKRDYGISGDDFEPKKGIGYLSGRT